MFIKNAAMLEKCSASGLSGHLHSPLLLLPTWSHEGMPSWPPLLHVLFLMFWILECPLEGYRAV